MDEPRGVAGARPVELAAAGDALHAREREEVEGGAGEDVRFCDKYDHETQSKINGNLIVLDTQPLVVAKCSGMVVALTVILHMTHFSNLPAIAARGGLVCENRRAAEAIRAVNIAYMNLKTLRGGTSVPVCKGGNLNDYVPFYFAPRSPMLYVISIGGIAGYPDGQEGVVYLVSNAEAVGGAGLPYALTDGHPVVAISGFYDDLKDLPKIDWATMKSRMWNDTPQYPDRRRRRQAEFLVHDFVPISLIQRLAVKTAATQAKVAALAGLGGWAPTVRVLPHLYF